MENKTQEQVSEDLQREFARDQFPECGGESKVECRADEKPEGWKWDIEHVCTECHLG
jgi:ribosomal protein L44E